MARSLGMPWLIACGALALGGCASGASREPAAAPVAEAAAASKAAEVAPRPPDAEQDARYYQARSAALASGTLDEVGRTDFVRFRRGRLYARSVLPTEQEQTLQRDLTAVLDNEDVEEILDVSAQVIADDQADIRAHMLRSLALTELDRSSEADFHREVAVALVKSILGSGNGGGFDSAWTVFSVKEEYDVVRVLGCTAESQRLVTRGERSFDILEARRLEDNQKLSLHFDVTELYAEEYRFTNPQKP